MRAVNLIPSEQRASGSVATRSGGAAYFVLLLLGGLAVLALLYGKSRHDIESSHNEVAALNARTQAVQQQVASLSPYTTFITLREQRVQAVAQLVGSRFDWPAAMGELSRVLPSDVALTSVQGTIAAAAAGATATTSASTPASGTSAAGSSVSSATPPGAVPSFTIVGCATSQTVVAQTLVRLRLIAGVKSVELQSSSKSSSGGASSGASSGSGSGACGASDPVFTADVAFDPLPATPTLVEGSHSASTSATGAGSSAAVSPETTR